MDELRWILLGIAVIVIAGIYFFSRSRKKETVQTPLDAANEMPHFSAKDEVDDGWVDGVGPVRVVDAAPSEQTANAGDPNVGKTSAGNTRVSRDEPSIKAIDEPVIPDVPENETSLPEDLPGEPPVEAQPDHVDHLHNPDAADTEEPVMQPHPEQSQDEPVDSIPRDAAEHQAHPEPAAQQEEPAIDDVIAVYVLAAEEGPVIKGEKILSASFALKLEYGDMKIFHRYTEASELDPASKKIRFSMANIMEPGWFDIDNINQLETRGVSFFMQVNLVDEPSRVLDDMLICAHGFATMLGARLCNPHRQLLDEAYTTSLREKVKKLETLKEQTQ